MSVRSLIALLAAGLLLAGCGSSASSSSTPVSSAASSQSSTASATTAAPDVRAQAREVLRNMEDPLLSTIVAARDRAQASQAGDSAKAARLERSMNRKLKTVQGFGRDAREHLIDVLDRPEAKATTKAADSWTHWAFELRTHPPANNFKQAQHIADLAAVAVRDFRAAYRAVGEQPPPAFRSR